MAFTNRRNQCPVGQGGFHFASLHDGHTTRLTYVYDCGAMAGYESARRREIDRYINQVGKRSWLDILYLSHVHADHINGLEQLLHRPDGVHVDTIVLPLINVEERLVAFARTAAEDPDSAGSEFYRSFILDPAAALSRFSPRQILFVQRGGDGGAPDGDGGPADAPDEFAVSGAGGREDKRSWTLTGRGNLSVNSDGTAAPKEVTLDDTFAIRVGGPIGDWLLAPFIDPAVEGARDAFLEALADQCWITVPVLEDLLRDPEFVEELVISYRDWLAEAYRAVTRDLNITSLSLFSGPVPATTRGIRRQVRGQFGKVHVRQANRVAWLACGDAALREIDRRDAFLDHYRRLLSEVGTLVLAHHGSDHNFDPLLLQTICPHHCIACADRIGNWNHPGSRVVQSVFSFPALFQLVTSAAVTEVWERAGIG